MNTYLHDQAPIDMTLLYIEGDSERRLYYTRILKALCNKVYISFNIEDGISQVARVCPDMILMDMGMQDTAGVSALQRLRELESETPIVIVSACEEVSCFQQAIEWDVSAYLLHPCSAEELKQTLCKVMKKCHQTDTQAPIILSEGLMYQESIKSLILDGKPVSLNKKEARLLEYLLKYKNVLITYEDIKKHIWAGADVSSASLRTLIKNLRKKGMARLIQNISGRGYVLNLHSKQ